MDTLLTICAEDIWFHLRSIEEDAGIYEEKNFNARANAIGFIDFHIIDRMEGLRENEVWMPEPDTLSLRAESLRNRLEAINMALFKRLREEIRAGRYAQCTFTKMIDYCTGGCTGNIGYADEVGYDNLDVFVNGLFSNRAMPEATKKMEPEMVFYQKTPARIIFEIAGLAQLKQHDVFFDMGAGLGQVAMLMHLITGATAVGIEYEPSYCDYALECVRSLNLSNVDFINADARAGDYSQGTAFFLYTPLEGRMLQHVLDTLREESHKRIISIFTYGSCSQDVARQEWLNCVNGQADNQHKVCGFKSMASARYFG